MPAPVLTGEGGQGVVEGGAVVELVGQPGDSGVGVGVDDPGGAGAVDSLCGDGLAAQALSEGVVVGGERVAYEFDRDEAARGVGGQ
ncbi:hypothetical protein EAO76_08300 [Streptomyces sp. sk2.1]|nr:hypothetical protein EAO76_08300 [Streptomyces sp. sk2.1]